jgi:serine/threonine protein phosphatase PrpC
MSQTDTEPDLSGSSSAPDLIPPRPFRVRSFGLTHPGQVRPTNEDHFAIVELARTLYVHRTSIPQAASQYSSHRGHVFVVADGMGGHRGGEVASALTVVTIEGFLLNSLRRFFHLETPEEQHVMTEFRAALLHADARVFEEAARQPGLAGMGATLTMAFVVDWTLFVAHAGDCRAYLYSQGELRQLTSDHTVAAELVRRGDMSPDAAAGHRFRHVVTNALGGTQPGARVELHKLDLEPDDVLLLCSDGLTEMVKDDRIAAVLGDGDDSERMCERLVAEANENGGKDNVTAVVGIFKDT